MNMMDDFFRAVKELNRTMNMLAESKTDTRITYGAMYALVKIMRKQMIDEHHISNDDIRSVEEGSEALLRRCAIFATIELDPKTGEPISVSSNVQESLYKLKSILDKLSKNIDDREKLR